MLVLISFIQFMFSDIFQFDDVTLNFFLCHIFIYFYDFQVDFKIYFDNMKTITVE